MKLILAAAICLIASFAIAVGCRHDEATSPTTMEPTIDAGSAHSAPATNPS